MRCVRGSSVFFFIALQVFRESGVKGGGALHCLLKKLFFILLVSDLID